MTGGALTQAIVATKAGGPEVLALVDLPMPRPGPGEVLVEMEAAGVAFADLMIREGRYPGVRPPVTPGYDIVGRVVARGDGAEALVIGERVAALTVVGGYSRHLVVRVADAVPAPDAADPAELVALVLNGVTAWQMLHRCAAVPDGGTALIHGAGGGVGLLLVQLCRLAGLLPLGTASATKHPAIERLGGRAIDYDARDFVGAVRSMTTGVGADVAFDHIGGAHVGRSLDALAVGGVCVSYGALNVAADGRVSAGRMARTWAGQPRLTPLDLMSANKGMVGYTITGRAASRPDDLRADLLHLFALHAAGTLEAPVATRLPLSRAGEAHRMLGGATVAGKIVLRPD